MKANEAESILSARLEQGQAVFSLKDLRSLFPERSEKTFTEGIRRLTRMGILTRVARGVYVNSKKNKWISGVLKRLQAVYAKGT